MSESTPEQEGLLRDLVAVLFVAGDGADRGVVQRALGLTPAQLTRVVEAARRNPPPGLLVQEQREMLRLISHPDAAAAVRRFLQAPNAIHLSGAALETLAVIAYTQPTTRGQIQEARGVASDGPITTLLQHGLIVEVGRAETPGRPTLFETTPEFLALLGLSSLDELPALTAEQ
jgi:segregation and condensation protein B